MIAILCLIIGLAAGFLLGALWRRPRHLRSVTVKPPRAGDVIRGPWTREGRWRS